jgi:glyoxylase-like metal-dependent hydrolase (beta-lactamase superfamily II)
MDSEIKSFYDSGTQTFSYVVSEQNGSNAIIIDSVLNYDPKSGRTSTHSADAIVDYVVGANLTIVWILETHAHADHLTAAQYLKRKLGGRIAIGNGIQGVQKVFQKVFNLTDDLKTDGSQFDHLLEDNEQQAFGTLSFKALSLPGHTPACMAYQVNNAVFVGDTIFMPDVGTARCDFPGGNAQHLYHSVKRLLNLPGATRLFMCHDYPSTSRPIAFETTVTAQKRDNIHIRDGVSEANFVKLRSTRDARLEMPNLMLPSIQINVRAGHRPTPEGNGISYLKIPMDVL